MTDDPRPRDPEPTEPSLIIGVSPSAAGREPSGIPRIGLAAAAVALVTAVAAATGGLVEVAPATTAPPTVSAPSDPPTTAAPVVAPSEPSWEEVSLPYSGVVSSVSHGPSGWIAVAPTTDGLRVLTSVDGSDWDATLLPTEPELSDGLGRGLGRALAGSSTLVVTAGRSGEASRLVAFVSDVSVSDGAAQWTPVDFPADAGHVRNLIEVDGRVYALGSSSTPDEAQRPAIWELDGTRWVDPALGDPFETDGEVLGVMTIAGSLAAVGSGDGLEVAIAEGGGWVSSNVEFPDPLSDVDPIDFTIDADDRAVVLAVARVEGDLRGVVLRSTDLATWELVGEPFPYLGVSLGRWQDDIVVLGDSGLTAVVDESGLEDVTVPIPGLILDAESDGVTTVAVGLATGAFDPKLWSIDG